MVSLWQRRCCLEAKKYSDKNTVFTALALKLDAGGGRGGDALMGFSISEAGIWHRIF